MNKVTVRSIRREISRIKARGDDWESVHADEDELHRSVLRAIADGAEDAASLARAVLHTDEIGGPRWYA